MHGRNNREWTRRTPQTAIRAVPRFKIVRPHFPQTPRHAYELSTDFTLDHGDLPFKGEIGGKKSNRIQDRGPEGATISESEISNSLKLTFSYTPPYEFSEFSGNHLTKLSPGPNMLSLNISHRILT